MKKDKLEIIKKEINPIIEQAEAIQIVNDSRLAQASEALSKLNVIGDKITAEKEKLTVPLNQALKEIRGRYKPVENIYETAITILRQKISAYQTEKIRKQREEEAKIAARLEKGTLKLETALNKLDELPVVQDKIATDTGIVKFREDKTLKIVDRGLIPNEYWVIDEKAVLNALKSNLEVPGASLETTMVPLNYR